MRLRDCLPEEGCGLLAVDSAGRVIRHFPIENVAHSRRCFRMDPLAQIKAMLWMETHHAAGMVIYHSHPCGPDHLSDTDLAETFYSDALLLLFFPEKTSWKARIWALEQNSPVEWKISVV